MYGKKKTSHWERMAKMMLAANRIGIRVEFRGDNQYVIVEDPGAAHTKMLFAPDRTVDRPIAVYVHDEVYPTAKTALMAIDVRLVNRGEYPLLQIHHNFHSHRRYPYLLTSE